MNIFFEKIKQKSFLAIITFFAAFFTTTLPYSIIALGMNSISDYLINLNFNLFFVISILGCVFANVLFSYLNSKSELDFYNSLPVSKKRMFFSNYFAGILLFVVPFILNYLFFIYLVNNQDIKNLMAMFYYICAFISIYSIFTVSTILTGNKFLSSLIGTLFILAPLLIIYIHNNVIVMFIQTNNTQLNLLTSATSLTNEMEFLDFFSYNEGFTIFILLLSPLVNLYYALVVNKNFFDEYKLLDVNDISFVSIICFFIFIVVATFKAYCFFKMRKSENFKKPVGINFLKIPLKCTIITVVAITMMANMIFYKGTLHMEDYIFSFIISLFISFLTYISLELIDVVDKKLEISIKSCFENSANYFASIALFIIIFSGYAVTINAYDEKIVPKEDILSIYIGEASKIDYYDSDIIDTYYELTKNGISNLNLPPDDKRYMEEICLTYNLKNGTKFRRNYMISKEQFYDANISLANSSEFIEKAIYQYVTIEDVEYGNMHISGINQIDHLEISETEVIKNNENSFIDLNPFEVTELISILGEELHYLDADYFKYNKPIYAVFVTENKTGNLRRFHIFEEQVKSVSYIQNLAESKNVEIVETNMNYDAKQFDALYLKLEEYMFYNEEFSLPTSYINIEVDENLHYDKKVNIILENNKFVKITYAEHINDICENLKFGFNKNEYNKNEFNNFGSDTIDVYAFFNNDKDTYHIGYIDCGIIN